MEINTHVLKYQRFKQVGWCKHFVVYLQNDLISKYRFFSLKISSEEQMRLIRVGC